MGRHVTETGDSTVCNQPEIKPPGNYIYSVLGICGSYHATELLATVQGAVTAETQRLLLQSLPKLLASEASWALTYVD